MYDVCCLKSEAKSITAKRIWWSVSCCVSIDFAFKNIPTVPFLSPYQMEEEMQCVGLM